MTEKEKIEKLRKHILKSKECFYDEGIDNYIYVKGIKLFELNDIYKSLTNEILFSELEMKLFNPVMYNAFQEQHLTFSNKTNKDTLTNYKSLINENKFIVEEIDTLTDKTINNLSTPLSSPVQLSLFQENYIINDYINKYFKYKDLYKEMNEEGRIIYAKDFPVIACTSYSICDDKDYIFYSKKINIFNQYALMKAGILIHEAAHVEDLKKVRDNYGRNKMFDYSSSFFTETNSFLSELNYIKYLESLNTNKKTIDELKKEFISKCFDIPLRINTAAIFDYNNMPPVILDCLFQDLRVLYSYSAALLLEDSKKDIKEKFDKEKLITNDITLFNNIDCDIKKTLIKKNLNTI